MAPSHAHHVWPDIIDPSVVGFNVMPVNRVPIVAPHRLRFALYAMLGNSPIKAHSLHAIPVNWEHINHYQENKTVLHVI